MLAVVKTRLIAILLEAIRLERSGQLINEQILRSTTLMLTELSSGQVCEDVYKGWVEAAYIDQLVEFYTRESALHVAENSCAEVLCRIELRIKEEQSRVERYLSRQSLSAMHDSMNRVWVRRYYSELASMPSGCKAMFKEDKVNSKDYCAKYEHFFNRIVRSF